MHHCTRGASTAAVVGVRNCLGRETDDAVGGRDEGGTVRAVPEHPGGRMKEAPMDSELRSWLQRQEAETKAIAVDQKRQADALTIMSRELANLTELLTPKTGDAESPLEQLLAQLVAQGKEQLILLRHLGQLMHRIERGLPSVGVPTSKQSNGSGRRLP
jgi:hypothetical protein